MPAELMAEPSNPNLYDDFARVATDLNVYTGVDYAEIIEHLNEFWKIGDVPTHPTPHSTVGRQAADRRARGWVDDSGQWDRWVDDSRQRDRAEDGLAPEVEGGAGCNPATQTPVCRCPCAHAVHPGDPNPSPHLQP